MNWGYKLTLVFLSFAGFMGTMVYKCLKSPALLVSEDYYKDELKYQQVIDGATRASLLSTPLNLTINSGVVWLQLPKEMQQAHGQILFYCISSGNNDRKAELIMDGEGRQQFSENMFKPGRYLVKVNWQAYGKNYYSEKEMIIQ